MLMAGLNESNTSVTSQSGAAGYTLKLPGKWLNLSALLYAKKFREYDYKTGAIAAFKELENAGLATLEETKTKTGTKVNRRYICKHFTPLLYIELSFD